MGIAVGDYDNDLDFLVNNNGERTQLLRNDGGNANHWLQLVLIGTRSNRDGVGSRVKLKVGDLVLTRQKRWDELSISPRVEEGEGLVKRPFPRVRPVKAG